MTIEPPIEAYTFAAKQADKLISEMNPGYVVRRVGVGATSFDFGTTFDPSWVTLNNEKIVKIVVSYCEWYMFKIVWGVSHNNKRVAYWVDWSEKEYCSRVVS